MRKILLLLPALVCAAALTASAASVRILVDKTPLRSAADSKAPVTLELKAGTVLDVLDVNRDWYKVRDPLTRKEGFVAAAAVDLQPGPAGSGTAPGTKPPATAPVKKAAPAPKPGDWTDFGYLSVNGIFEGASSSFTQSQSWTSFAEPATVAVTFPAKNAPGVAIEGGYRVWRNLAVGVGITAVSRTTTAAVTGSLPNPLYLNRPIAITGGFDASNSETGIHLQAVWAFPVSPKMTLMVSAGPSFFSVKQTVVQAQGIGLSSAYPFTSGAITSAATTDATKTGIGFGVGMDVAYYFSKAIGVGGMVRYAHANVDVPVAGQPSVAVSAGGVMVGGGLRVRFPAAKPSPKPPAKPDPKPAPTPASKKK